MPTITKNVIFVAVAGTHLEHHAAAPVIVITFDEMGYNPAIGNPEPEYVDAANGGPVPRDVLESAISASMFGWHTPAAKAARLWFAQRVGTSAC